MSMIETPEIRTFRGSVPALTRAEPGSTLLRGHFATFMQPYDLGYCWEQVDPGAFDRTLREHPDILALLNHSSLYPLARTTALTEAGKLTITIDATGPVAEFRPTDTQYGRDLIANVDAGVVRAMSFGFDIKAEKFEKRDDGSVLYTLLDVDLWECSPVTFPANPATDLKTQRRAKREAEIARALRSSRRFFAVTR